MTSPRTGHLETSLGRALAFLDRTLAVPTSEIQQTAAIKAFEYCFELAWRLLRARLLSEGVQATTPRAVFRAAGHAGLVDSVERWLDYLEARNLTVHTYQEATAAAVYARIAGSFRGDVAALLGPGPPAGPEIRTPVSRW